MAAPSAIVSLVLLVVGCLLLSTLLVTVILSERLRRRDLVFNNFLSTWILSSALNSLDLLVLLADKGQKELVDIHGYVLLMITMVSTLNVSVHLWFIMHEGMHPSSIRTKKLRILILVVTPYLFGLLPIVFIFSESVGLPILALAWILTVVSNTILDLVLVIKYWRYHWKTRDTEIQGVMSLPFLLKLLAFALYQVIFVLLFIVVMVNDHSESAMMAFKTVQYSFPLLAFFVLGSHSDIWQLWFPCFWARKRGNVDIENAASVDRDRANRISEDKEAAQHLLVINAGDREEDSAEDSEDVSCQLASE